MPIHASTPSWLQSWFFAVWYTKFLPVATARWQAVQHYEVSAKSFLSPVLVFLHCTMLFIRFLLLQHGSPVSCSPSEMSLSCHELLTDSISSGCPVPPGASCNPVGARPLQYWVFFQDCLSSYVHKNDFFLVFIYYILFSFHVSSWLPYSLKCVWGRLSGSHLQFWLSVGCWSWYERLWRNMCNDFFFLKQSRYFKFLMCIFCKSINLKRDI